MSVKTVLFVGDTAPRRADPDSMFKNTSAYLKTSDLLFGQLEAVMTDRGAPACQCRLPMRIPPAVGACLKRGKDCSEENPVHQGTSSGHCG